jgi:hypothetical protein
MEPKQRMSGADKAAAVRQMLKDFQRENYRSRSLELRMSLANIIIDHLKRSGWTQQTLADKAGIHPPQLSLLINAERDWTCDTAAKVLFALGIHANVVEVAPELGGMPMATDDSPSFRIGDTAHGETSKTEASWIAHGETGGSFLIASHQPSIDPNSLGGRHGHPSTRRRHRAASL